MERKGKEETGKGEAGCPLFLTACLKLHPDNLSQVKKVPQTLGEGQAFIYDL